MSIRTNLGATSLVLASASQAYASDHLMKVGEVMLANAGGSTAVQFIELEDPAVEPFPATPYVLEVYDAAGVKQTTYTLTLPNGTQRYTLATTQAQTDLAFTAQQNLTATLPSNGQACFRRNGSPPQNIHCLAWGTITSIVPNAGSMNNGASPSNGMSVQRVSGTYVVAAPTPNAVNSNGMVDMPMVDAPPMPDAGVTPDASVTPDAPSGSPVTPKDDDDGCSVGASASWFGLAFMALLLIVRRSSNRRRR